METVPMYRQECFQEKSIKTGFHFEILMGGGEVMEA